MDLRFGDAEPTDEERVAVDHLLGPPGSAWQGADRTEFDLRHARGGVGANRRDLLLPALHSVNDRVGWISPGALTYICRRLTVPPADAYAVATFYAMFAMEPRPARVIHVCTDVVCAAAGSDAVCADLESEIGSPGATDGPVTWHQSPCLGMCERAPATLAIQAGTPPTAGVCAPVDTDALTRFARAPQPPHAPPATKLGNGDRAEPVTTFAPDPPPGLMAQPPAETAVPQRGDPELVLLGRVGVADPESIDDYRSHGGYSALRRALSLGSSEVIREVRDSGLTGRGGAAFPTGVKWEGTARQPDFPHYVVCNADESEPGTFKDRVLMEGDPFAVVEALTIAGYANGAAQGYLYLRGEYPRALSRLERAIVQARDRGLLGENILGSGFAFDIEIRRGAGAYICGEETAVFTSIEGLRGEPRAKPPFPTQRGLFAKPTTINNVETLVNVLPILSMGGPEYAKVGTEKSSGTKLFCVSGAVEAPGVYEVPFGVTLRTLVDLAGGVRPGHDLSAVLLGGAAGGFVGPEDLDLALTFEGTRAAGTTLGSGVVLVLDDTADIPRLLTRIAAFFRDESCGQCVPCRVGTVRQEESLQRLAAGGTAPAEEIQLLRDVGTAMRDASICGLGQTAWNAVESAIDRIGVFSDPPATTMKEQP